MLYDPIRHHDNETVRNLAELRDCLRDKGRWPQDWIWDFNVYDCPNFGRWGNCGSHGCAIGMYAALKGVKWTDFDSVFDKLFPDMETQIIFLSGSQLEITPELVAKRIDGVLETMLERVGA